MNKRQSLAQIDMIQEINDTYERARATLPKPVAITYPHSRNSIAVLVWLGYSSGDGINFRHKTTGAYIRIYARSTKDIIDMNWIIRELVPALGNAAWRWGIVSEPSIDNHLPGVYVGAMTGHSFIGEGDSIETRIIDATAKVILSA